MIGFDDQTAYVGTPTTLWRVERGFTSSSGTQRVSLEPGEIQNLYVFSDALFVLKTPDGKSNVLLRSTDHASTFQAIDAGLEVEEFGVGTKLVPTRMARVDAKLIVNAGGGRNIFVSADDGRAWTVLAGELSNQICYPGKFLLNGYSLIAGGECPLDAAYLTMGTLSSDYLRWETAPISVSPCDLSNRNVQFIERIDAWGMLIAGVEGGLLASDNAGARWSWMIQLGLGEGSYPYIQSFCQLPADQNVAFAGGFDKAKDAAPYLACTFDEGETWEDVSGSLQTLGEKPQQTLTLTAHPDGRVLVAIYDAAKAEIIAAELDKFV